MKQVDLHSHTTASDGSLTPVQLVDRAKEIGLAALAVTDHDTVAGLDEAIRRGNEAGVEVIPGIELATVEEDCDVHLVGLFIDYKAPALLELLKGMSQSRAERNLAMVDKLQEAGLNIRREDLDRFRGSTIARGHIAAILIERGYAANTKEALLKYMSPGTMGYVRRQTPSPEACIQAVHQIGGLIFVAHINQIDRRDWDRAQRVCRRMLEAGADGLETLYCEYDDVWRQRAEALRAEVHALASGGSDFHGDIKPGLALGSGYGDLFVPYDFVEAMKQKLEKS